MIKISCIIPAYNEEKNIKNTLDVVLDFLGNEIYEIVVIDDFSEDKTVEIIEKNYPSIKLIKNSKNLWKSASVAKWIENSNWNFIFLLDADLIWLKKENIKNILRPILWQQYDVTISFLKNSIPLFPFKKIDYCSGQRVISKAILTQEINKIKELKSYWLEVFINYLIIKNKLSIKVVKWENVENNFHHKKDGFIRWWWKNLKIWHNVLKHWNWIIWVYKMNIELEKLLK